MNNCMIAQSGGPTSVINSSLAGVICENNKNHYFDNVYGGLKGIEGIAQNRIINLSKLSQKECHILKYTPSAFLGSCRHKLNNFIENEDEYIKIFSIFDKYDIDTFFYIGGNDSMDSVDKLNQYAKFHGLSTKIIGIPKTIDNDLVITDHTPGYGSAAKYIATLTLETYLDSKVYSNNGVFLLETMGRDTGWLAASSCLAQIDNSSAADFIYLPESKFDTNQFLKDIEEKLHYKKGLFIVVSEGIKDGNGEFIVKENTVNGNDKFGHAMLGGVSDYLKQTILEAGLTKKVRNLVLGTTQRCSMHNSSKTDIDEAYLAGKVAIDFSKEGLSGYIVGFKRKSNSPYMLETFPIKASDVANNIKYYPKEWINNTSNSVTIDAYNYILPLIQGSPSLEFSSSIPKYITIENIKTNQAI